VSIAGKFRTMQNSDALDQKSEPKPRRSRPPIRACTHGVATPGDGAVWAGAGRLKCRPQAGSTPESHIQRLANRTSRLQNTFATIDVAVLGNRLIQNFVGRVDILRLHAEFKPSMAFDRNQSILNVVVVVEKTLDPSGFNTSFGEQRFRQPGGSADCDQLAKFRLLRVGRKFFWQGPSATIHLGGQHIAR